MHNEMDTIAKEYDSPTNYLIVVDKKEHFVGIYEGGKGKWTRLHRWICSVGAPESPTPSGSFLMGSYDGLPFHQKGFGLYEPDGTRAHCRWATRITTNGFLFHSIIYAGESTQEYIYDGRLGEDVTHGCVRLHIENAKWIYDNIPESTRCVIY
ncbi:MAG: L,D-transpeptidase [Clostridia bacterium]|nr:L,D-transpeptidase [Clostridia bacterium]